MLGYAVLYNNVDYSNEYSGSELSNYNVIDSYWIILVLSCFQEEVTRDFLINDINAGRIGDTVTISIFFTKKQA